jgi:hypothetical protein
VGDACPTSPSDPVIELNDGMPHTVHTGDVRDDYRLSCNNSTMNDMVFRLTLAAPSDVTLSIATSRGAVFASLRDSPCGAPAVERMCRVGDTVPLTIAARSLPAGTYWLIAEDLLDPDVTVAATIATPPVPTVMYAATTPADATFVNACAVPGHATLALPSPDNSFASVPAAAVPFPLRMYDVASTAVSASANGWLSLMSTLAVGTVGGPTEGPMLPDPAPPNLTVAPYWTDLFQRAGTGQVCYATTGTAPNRSFVVEWSDFHYCCTDDPSVHLTFEVVFHEAAGAANNVIDVIYNEMDGAHAANAGIENSTGDVGSVIPGPFTPPRAVRFTPM